MISWAARKQLTYFLILLTIVIVVVFYVFIRITSPTCVDGKKNQAEEGVDCGGPCEVECLGEIRDLIVVWSRPVKVDDGVYDVVALIDNPNISLGVRSVNYTFRVYDDNNVLIDLSSGQTFISPGERFALFASNIDSGHKVPARAFLEFDKKIEWEKMENGNTRLLVTNKDFINGEYPHLNITIKNSSLSSVKDVSVVVVLYDKNKKIIGSSATKMDSVEGDDSTDIVFTWTKRFKEDPYSTEIFLRAGL